MKTKKQIREEIKRIKADSRWPRTARQVATIEINAPLALIQQSMESRVGTLEWVMEPGEEK